MHRQTPKLSHLLSTLLTVLLLLAPLPTPAGTGDDQLASDIDKAIRAAEKLTFAGANQEAAAIMSEVGTKLGDLQALNPSNRKINELTMKFSQLQKKIGKQAPAGTSAAIPATPQQPSDNPPAVKAASQGSGNVTEALSGVAAIAFNGLTGHLDRAEKTMQAGTGDLGKGSLIKAEEKYQELTKRLPNLAALPEVAAVKERLDTLNLQVEKAGAQQKNSQEQGKVAKEEQTKLITQWRKIFMSYTTPREAKYLGDHPELLDEAKNLLGEYQKTSFPLGQPAELESYLGSFTKAIDKTAADKGAAGIDERWLSRIKPLLTVNDPAYINPSGPSLSQPETIAQMDKNLAAGKQLLAEYDREFAGGQSTHFLNQAIDDLRRAVNSYQEGKKSAFSQHLADIRRGVDRGLALMDKNIGWTPESGKPINFLNKSDITEISTTFDKLKALPGVPADSLAALEQDITRLIAEDKKWRELKTAQDNGPKPFPPAGMTSASLAAEMEKILKDRGIWPIDKLVIVDKDWWVQQGEFRYIKAAALQKDGEGPYFTFVTFKQMLTLSGYGPTELWEQGRKQKIAP